MSTGNSPRTMSITGRLDSDSVPDRAREIDGWFESEAALDIDLAGVERVDSAGVALLLDWLRAARRRKTALGFVNAPDQMRAIVNFCALDDVLPLNSSTSKATD